MPPVAQQLSGHSEDCYEALVEHLRSCLGRLVFCHHSQGIPREMVCHHKDVFHHGGLVQLHCGLDAGVVEMHKLQRGIRSNRTQGCSWHFSLVCLAAQASPYYSSAILSHHGPPEPLLCEGQGSLLTLLSGVPMYPIERHTALSRRDDEGQHSLSLAFQCHVDIHQTLFKTRLLRMPCSVSASAPRHSSRRVSHLDGGIPFLRQRQLRHAARATSASCACSQSTTCISSSFAA